MARFCPLFSGSSGNSSYLGSRSAGVLIDAGVSARRLEGRMKLCGIDPLAIGGILVTHEHSDHISGLRVFAKKYGLTVYGSAGTIGAIRDGLEGVELREIGDGAEIAGMEVRAFPTSHDCAEPTGYRIHTADGRDFCLATDLGYLSDRVKENLLGCNMVMIESNHDIEMLRNGPYPYYLKRRILSDQGHLSNAGCAEFLPQLLKSGVRRFMLAHLSDTNNTPRLAYETSLAALVQAGFTEDEDFILSVAMPENTESRTVIF